MREYFRVAIKHQIELDNGKIKKLTESFLYNSMSFTESEARANKKIEDEELSSPVVDSIKRVKYTEVQELDNGDIYFETDLKEEFEDEKGKKTFVKQKYLTRTDSVSSAEEFIINLYEKTTIPFKIQSVRNSKIVKFIVE